MEPELIEITVVSAPPYTAMAYDGNWFAETTPVAIGNMQATLYDRTDWTDGSFELLRSAQVQDGTLQLGFLLHVMPNSAYINPPTEKVDRDTSLYLGMLQGFHLTTN
jgi:hypothetical protein